MKVLDGIGARKHPSNEGRVSGEGVSLRAHFNPSPVFLSYQLLRKDQPSVLVRDFLCGVHDDKRKINPLGYTFYDTGSKVLL